MLTTVGLIFGAYLIQDYLIAWSRRRRRYYHLKKGSVRHSLAIGSLLSLVIFGGMAVSVAGPTPKPGINVFLGTLDPGGYPTKINQVSDYYQINSPKSESKPAYVFLNPGTPAALIKPPKASHLRKRHRPKYAKGLKTNSRKKFGG
jgi:hypothetical protein